MKLYWNLIAAILFFFKYCRTTHWVIPFKIYWESLSSLVVIVQLLSCVRLCNPMDCGTTISWSLLKLMSIESVMHPTISSSVIPFYSCPQSFPASASFPVSQLFPSGGPKYWSFIFSISPCNEYSGLISSRIDWFDLLAAQGVLRSLLQHHSSKASILIFHNQVCYSVDYCY